MKSASAAWTAITYVSIVPPPNKGSNMDECSDEGVSATRLMFPSNVLTLSIGACFDLRYCLKNVVYVSLSDILQLRMWIRFPSALHVGLRYNGASWTFLSLFLFCESLSICPSCDSAVPGTGITCLVSLDEMERLSGSETSLLFLFSIMQLHHSLFCLYFLDLNSHFSDESVKVFLIEIVVLFPVHNI